MRGKSKEVRDPAVNERLRCDELETMSYLVQRKNDKQEGRRKKENNRDWTDLRAGDIHYQSILPPPLSSNFILI